MLNQLIKNIIDQNKVATEATTLDAAINCLKTVDKDTHAWTDEDGNWEARVREEEGKKQKSENMLCGAYKPIEAFTVESCLHKAI